MNFFMIQKDGKDLFDNDISLFYDFKMQQFTVFNKKVGTQVTFDKQMAENLKGDGKVVEFKFSIIKF